VILLQRRDLDAPCVPRVVGDVIPVPAHQRAPHLLALVDAPQVGERVPEV
jgi:hypothetical protein